MKLGTANPCHANALRHVRGLRATLPELFQCGGQNRAVCDVPPYFWLCRQLSRCVLFPALHKNNQLPTLKPDLQRTPCFHVVDRSEAVGGA